MTADPALPPSAVDEDEPPEPVYASVQDWVTAHFLPMYRRPLGGEYRWCPQWWRHAEAITRLTALWQSWEAMRLQPGTGTANWLRDHLDHQLPILLGRSGPFAQCTADEHIEPPHRRRRPAAPRLVGHRGRPLMTATAPRPWRCPCPACTPGQSPGPRAHGTTARPGTGHDSA